MVKPLNTPLVEGLDTNADEVAGQMSGFIVTPQLKAEKLSLARVSGFIQPTTQSFFVPLLSNLPNRNSS